MKKKLVTVLVLITLMGLSVAAEGKQEVAPAQGERNYAAPLYQNGRGPGLARGQQGPMRRSRGGQRFYRSPGSEELEAPVELTLKGKVDFVEGDFPRFTSAGTNYTLLYPYWAAEEIEIEEGQEVTITGYLTPAPLESAPLTEETREELAKRNFLHVSGAIIDGKEYILPGRGPINGPGNYNDCPYGLEPGTGFHNRQAPFGRGFGRGRWQ